MPFTPPFNADPVADSAAAVVTCHHKNGNSALRPGGYALNLLLYHLCVAAAANTRLTPCRDMQRRMHACGGFANILQAFTKLGLCCNQTDGCCCYVSRCSSRLMLSQCMNASIISRNCCNLSMCGAVVVVKTFCPEAHKKPTPLARTHATYHPNKHQQRHKLSFTGYQQPNIYDDLC